jgi:antitoxin component HigA of HigAB toxin-antitoxin module
MERSIHEQFLETPENQRLYQQEKLLVEVTELLAKVMDKKEMNRSDLARAIGKSKAFVTQVLRGNHNMTLRTVADLFWAMRHDVVVEALPCVGDEGGIADLDLDSPSGYYAFWSHHFARQAQAALPRSAARGQSRAKSARRAQEVMPPNMNVAA